MKALHSPLFISLFFITCNLLGMEDKKPTRCETAMASLLLGGNMERALTAYHLKKRTFKPFALETFEEAQTLFAKKGIKVDKICITLQDDPHLVKVAREAQLNGLCILSGNIPQESILYDACTGRSVTQFKDGYVYHAIAIPDTICANLDQQKRHPVICGIIEREIARISKAYSEEDGDLTAWKHALYTRIPCGLLALVALYYDPTSLFLSGPLGFLTSSMQQEYTECSIELACDQQAAQLARTTDNLMATLLHSTSSFIIAERDSTYAQQAYEGKSSTCSSMSVRAQRMHNLLQTQECIKKNE